jgi:hypothetical protein
MEKTLLNYSSNNINKLDIYFGTFTTSSKDASIFNKKLDSTEFNKYYEEISSKNYSMKHYKQKMYQHGTNYYDIYSKKYSSKTNISKLKSDKHLYITYLETLKESYHFDCQRDFNVIEQSVAEFKVNNEISIYFINNNQIKIGVTLNHNVDHSIKILFQKSKLFEKVTF